MNVEGKRHKGGEQEEKMKGRKEGWKDRKGNREDRKKERITP